MTCTFRPARLTDVGPIAVNMREMDRIECQALGRTPKEALRGGLRCSLGAYTALVEDKPVAMLGCAPAALLGSRGMVWMLGTEEIYRQPRALLFYAPLFLEHWLETFEVLENIIAARNEKAIRLLERWGFNIADTTDTYGQVEFVRFWKVRAEAIQGSAPLP